MRNIDHYIESIISVDVEIIRLSYLEMSGQNDNLLLNIDAQVAYPVVPGYSISWADK